MNQQTIRNRRLSTGWYPDDTGEIINIIEKNCTKTKKAKGIAAIIPHAGWSYSGALAIKTISSLDSNPDTVIIIGGHLPPFSSVYYSPEDIFRSPLGDFIADKEFVELIDLEFHMKEDFSSDNTVEITIPILKYFFPDSKIVWLRVGSGPEAIKLGSLIYKISLDLNRSVVVIGSTDLTHYGFNFSFNPKGNGEMAINWVKEVNDKRIVDKMTEMNYQKVLSYANKEFSACSSGAASAAIRFAYLSGIKKGNFIGYSNSYDIEPSDSFVGYVGITY